MQFLVKVWFAKVFYLILIGTIHTISENPPRLINAHRIVASNCVLLPAATTSIQGVITKLSRYRLPKILGSTDDPKRSIIATRFHNISLITHANLDALGGNADPPVVRTLDIPMVSLRRVALLSKMVARLRASGWGQILLLLLMLTLPLSRSVVLCDSLLDQVIVLWATASSLDAFHVWHVPLIVWRIVDLVRWIGIVIWDDVVLANLLGLRIVLR